MGLSAVSIWISIVFLLWMNTGTNTSIWDIVINHSISLAIAILLVTTIVGFMLRFCILQIINYDGLLYSKLNSTANMLSVFSTELHAMAASHKSDHYDVRMDESRYSGEFALLAREINAMVFMYVDDTIELLEIMREYGNGNFKVDERKYFGDFAWANEIMDNVKYNFIHITEEINKLAENISNGNFHTTVDIGSAKGEWEYMLNRLNILIKDIEEPLTQIEENIVIMAHGDFSPLEGNFKGQFKVIQDACNLTNEHTLDAIAEIATVLGSMAKGDLTTSVKRDYVGSYIPIKTALTTILMSLNRTISDISAASAQVSLSAKQISISAVDLANGAQEQALSVEELNATIDMINHQTQQNANNASEDIRYKGGKRKPSKISWQRLIRSRLEAVCTKEDSGTQSICNMKTGNGITIAELLPFPYRNTPRKYNTIIA